MSREIALQNILLQPAERWGHTEYSLTYHTDYFTGRTGVQAGDPGFSRAVNDLWELDFNWSTNDGLYGDWDNRGRATDMGHAGYALNDADKREAGECPFAGPEEVWAFDAVAEYGLPSMEAQVAAYERQVQEARRAYPNQLSTGGYYKTIISGAIAAFGWDMLLLASAEPEKMEPVFDSFFRRTLFHMEAWARTSVEVVIQHDDFVWSSGAFMYPEIYRRAIIPRYAELWKPLHAAGKTVLFCSDGDFTEFAPDIQEAGSDGLIFEPMMDFGWMAERFGDSQCLVGSYVDCRDMTFGSWEKVRADIDRTLEALARCKGALFAVGNHLPANIPADMMDRFIEYVKPRLARQERR